MGIESVLETLRRDPSLHSQITHWQKIPAKSAQLADFPAWMDEDLKTVLRKRGIGKLYTHQAEACGAVWAGDDVVVVTPTASGKSLCYNIPVFQRIHHQPEARALYLFPTKALAQDQVAELMQWSDELGGTIKTYTYDGDTPASARRAIRSAGSIVVTNPDMLHSGILPHHTKWIRLFENLEYVVIDELHSYRGVFGSHVANVLRRLHRICRFYGSRPQFVCASATIANPGDHAAALIGRPAVVIDNNGAPQGEKDIILYNPPVVNASLGIRRSALLEAQKIAALFLKDNIQTIVFARSRTDTEVLVTYLRRAIHRLGQPQTIRGYRGGYLPKQRREIERDLRRGEVLGVVSTNALELGVDIGSLQAAVLTGYPGTIASTWQQMGRAGRSDESSAVVIVCNSSPLNQFVVNHPDFIMGQGAERALVNPDNMFILVSHIKCAAFELPFTEGELYGGSDPTDILDFLVEEHVLRRAGDRWYWMSENYPAVHVSLRSASTDNFTIVDTTNGSSTIIGEVDRFSAPMMIHEGAIYIHESSQYHIDQLDFDRQKAYAHQVKADYYTDANLAVELKVLDTSDSCQEGIVTHSWGEVMVAAKTHMYKKIRFYTHENLGWGEVSLPELETHTTAYWFVKPTTGPTDTEALQSALMGAANILRNTAPLELMCEPSDLGVVAQVRSPFTQGPTIFIYEKYPGGVGFSQRLYDIREALLSRCIELLRACPCENGCPSCVGPGDEVGPRGKHAARQFLEEALQLEIQG